MKIGRKFNTLTFGEYFFYLDSHKAYSDFNILGIFRSIIENDKLGIDEKISIRDHANRTFGRTFHFLQLKDPTRISNYRQSELNLRKEIAKTYGKRS